MLFNRNNDVGIIVHKNSGQQNKLKTKHTRNNTDNLDISPNDIDIPESY